MVGGVHLESWVHSLVDAPLWASDTSENDTLLGNAVENLGATNQSRVGFCLLSHAPQGPSSI
jgi:hypothetical protein